MSRHFNQAKLREIQASLNLVDMCKVGFWWCRDCQHITQIEDGTNGASVCVICGSTRIKHNPPIDDNQPDSPALCPQKS